MTTIKTNINAQHLGLVLQTKSYYEFLKLFIDDEKMELFAYDCKVNHRSTPDDYINDLVELGHTFIELVEIINEIDLYKDFDDNFIFEYEYQRTEEYMNGV
jgi:hypothetical protein